MPRATQPERAVALVLELGSGTAVVDGERIELPAKELRLLAELAARPGEAVASPQLIAAAWPEAPWMTAQDLYWHISQLRRDLGGSERARKMVRNRRGFGYLLDIPPDEVIVLEADRDLEAEPDTIWLDEIDPTPTTAEPAEESPPKPPVVSSEAQGRRRRIPRLALTAILIAALIAASWSTGFLLSKWRATHSLDHGDQQPHERQEQAQEDGRNAPQEPRQDRSQKLPEEPGRRGDRARGAPLAGPPNSTDQGDAPTSAIRPPQQPPRPKDPGKKDSRPPSLPPAPTRYLYHLVNAETGDHFATTDGGIASEYEAKGYEGSAIGRVYTAPEDNTKAIITNYGTAYIFIGSSPKTEPASKTAALWYSSDNEGDFFYTTSKSEASQEGWSATLIGYIRTLS